MDYYERFSENLKLRGYVDNESDPPDGNFPAATAILLIPAPLTV